MTLFKQDIQEHLTAPNPEQTRQARASHPGMAHFAGTGPRGMTCRQCAHWEHYKGDYHSVNGKHHGLIKPARCRKYRAITNQRGAMVPDDAEACRHFEHTTNEVPARFYRP
jgi:hypothetical protein